MTDSTNLTPDVAEQTGQTSERLPQVVFVCRANGGRSAISRVLTDYYADGRVRALSAGTEPGEHIHPEVARALEDLRFGRLTRGAQARDYRDGCRQRHRDHRGLRRQLPLP